MGIKFRTTAKITCDTCGVNESGEADEDAEFLRVRLERRGWKYPGDGKAVCDDCAEKKRGRAGFLSELITGKDH